jgi:hypothetical protein
MPRVQSKVTLEPIGRNSKLPWSDPKKPMPLLYRVVGLSNCMLPQIGARLTDDDVVMLLDGGRNVVIRESRNRS